MRFAPLFVLLIAAALPARGQIKSYPDHPSSYSVLEQYYPIHAKYPQGAGWLFFSALEVYKKDGPEAQKALQLVLHPRLLVADSEGNKQLRPSLRDSLDQALAQMPFLPTAYYLQSLPSNGYEPQGNYRIMWVDPIEQSKQQEGLRILWLKSNGSKQLREMRLRKTGNYWKVASFRELLRPLTPNQNTPRN